MFSRLQRQLMLICVVGAGLVLVTMSLVSLAFSRNLMQKQAAETFEKSLDGILLHIKDGPIIEQSWLAQTEANEELYITTMYNDQFLHFTNLNENRREHTQAALSVAMDNYDYDPALPPTTLLPVTITFPMTAPSSARGAVSKVPYNGAWITVVVVKSMAKENKQLFSLQLFFSVASLVALVALGIFSWRFTGHAIKPIEENHKRQIDFVSSASHEIRSPLAVISATVGAMRDAPPEKVAQFATTIEQECTRLGFLTQDLLTLASADSDTLYYNPSHIEPETLLLTACERFEALAQQKNIALIPRLASTPSPLVFVDIPRVEQLLAVLIDNAICHTPEGGTVELSLQTKGNRTQFVVEDSGPGIPLEERPLIFKRFYRGDFSRREKTHYGLGLAIAQEIAQSHNGKLTLEDSPLGGARFGFSVPTNPWQKHRGPR